MLPLVPSMAAVAVSVLYCVWQHHHQDVLRKRRVLRERVAYLLWVVAERTLD